MIDIAGRIAGNRAGDRVGMACCCTANAHALRAALLHARDTGRAVVIEATSNQVNQEGGYTGMTPADFIGWIGGLAADAGVTMDAIIPGGDHLGPDPWRAEPAKDNGREMVRL